MGNGEWGVESLKVIKFIKLESSIEDEGWWMGNREWGMGDRGWV